MWLLMHLVLGLGSPRPALLAALLTILGSQLAEAQLSIPVTTVHDFAGALQNANVSEIILDPSGTGVGGGTFTLRGDLWVKNTFDVQPNRRLTIRSVNGNPTMLDLGGIPAVLEIRNGGYLELRDMLLKNIATEQELRNPNFTSYIRPNFTRVSGMLSWPSFYAEAGSSYGVYNTTQYFWSNTIFYRGDCDWQNPVTPPDSQKVNTLRGQQTYSYSSTGFTLLAESHLYHAQYPVLDYNTSQSEGVVDVFSENSYGVCVPVNSSANEIIVGMARASALQNSGSNGSSRSNAVIIGSVVGAAVALALLAGLVGLVFWVRRKRREESVRNLSDLGALPGTSEGAPMLGAGGASVAQSASTSNTQMESHLLRHGRLRRLGQLDEEQVEVGPLLGRGSFGRVYKGRWRSTLVAIKVVEHSPGVSESMSLAEQKIEREALLATSLSHPNIIATFKICTMTAGSAVGQKKAAMSRGDLSLRRPSDPRPSDRQASQHRRDSGAQSESESLGRGQREMRGTHASPGSAFARAEQGFSHQSNGGQLPSTREMGSENSEVRPSSHSSSRPGSRNEGRPERQSSRPASQPGSTNAKGSEESFDPKTAFVVDLPKSDVVVEGQKKGSDSAINNGGKRPGLVGASPTEADIELTPGEREQEDEEAAIEERMSRLLETWCLMEYAEKGSLADALRTGRLKRPGGFPELGVIIACLQDIASGMEYLHSAGILHGDLKPANVLLKSTSADRRGFLCKLCDFGMSRLLDATHATHVSTQTYGTMPYMPPELLAQSQLTPKADVYSFGIVMWELLSGQMPFASLTVGQVFFAVVHEKTRPPLDAFDRAKQELPEEDHRTLDAYSALMQHCWAEKSADRPTFPEILSELGTFRAKISMRLSSKPSDQLGLRKMSSVRSGVGSPNAGGAGSPFQPASQRKAEGEGPSGASPVGDEGGLALLRSPSFQKGGGLPAAAGDSPRGPPRDPRIPPSGPNLAGNPEAIQAKSVSLRDNVPVSRAQLLGGLGTAGRSDSAKTRPSLSLKDLSDDVREKLAASQAAAAAGGSNNSEGVQGRQPLTGKSGSAKAERSFSF